MSAYGDVLERAVEHYERAINPAHYVQATRALRDAIDQFTPEDRQRWKGFVREIVVAGKQADKDGDWSELDRLVLVGYRRLLLERDPHSSQDVVVRTQQDWDSLPDRSFEDIGKQLGTG